MIIGHHLIWTAYGWWLPNDPRGSSSHDVAVERIAELGPHHYGRKQQQPAGQVIREFYQRAGDVLTHDLLTFEESDIEVIAESFAQTIERQRYTCYACVIMPDHVHALIRKHRDSAEQMIEHLQKDSRQALIDAGRRSADHPVWGGPGWKVFLYSRNDIERTISYIEQNSVKINRPVQQGPFVAEYDGWLPGRHPERMRNDKSPL